MPVSRKSNTKRGNGKSRTPYTFRKPTRAPTRRTTYRPKSRAYTYDRPGPWGTIGRTIGGAAATFLGGPTAAAAGRNIGGLAHYVGRIFGSGSYSLGGNPQVNSLFKGAKNFGQTKNFEFGERTLRFKHREYVGDIVSSSIIGAFNNQLWAINPGMNESFPFLATLAQNFTTYKMHGLVYEFKSMSSPGLATTSSATGSIIAVVDYNPASGPFVSKQDMLNSEGSIDSKPSEGFLMGVECDPKKLTAAELYIRTTVNPSNSDPRYTDLGILNVATIGINSSSLNLGELYAIYDVEFLLPQLNPLGSTDQSALVIYDPSVVTSLTVLPNYNFYIPTLNLKVLKSLDMMGIIMLNTGGHSYISFPSSCAGGTYEVFCYWEGTPVALAVVPQLAVVNNTTLISYVGYPIINVTSGLVFFKAVVKVPNLGVWNWDTRLTGHFWPAVRLTNSTATLPTTLTRVSLSVKRLNAVFGTDESIATAPPGGFANGW